MPKITETELERAKKPVTQKEVQALRKATWFKDDSWTSQDGKKL
jgi:hypothetical protein